LHYIRTKPHGLLAAICRYALSIGSSDQLQTGAIVGVFAVARDEMQSEVQTAA
jgi:hypothetical protein